MKMNINGEVRELTDEEIKELGIMETDPQLEIETLKSELATYDYIGVKIAMGVATTNEYAEQIAYTETLREKIRDLEAELLEINEVEETEETIDEEIITVEETDTE